ncbi:hypothetical protein [Cribrihabitans pelagius]|uniref:hypothetical protein n=1 Tax=Cribrihabitans pelagius TaxID=1765746 RepID=UPI003B5963E1
MVNQDTGRTVFSNFRAIFVGRLVASLSTWLSLVVLAKLSAPETVGIYALAQAICMPVAEIAKMGLREARSSDTREQFQYGDYLALRIAAVAVALVLISAAGIAQAGTEVFLVILLYGLNRCFWLLSDILYAHFQLDERMDLIGRSLNIVGPLSLLFLTLGFYLTGSLVAATLGQLLAHAAVFVFHDLAIARERDALKNGGRLMPNWNPKVLGALSLQVMPLVFATFLIVGAIYFPRVKLEAEFGLASLGIYAAILALAMAPVRLVTSLGVATSVRLARMFADREFSRFLALLAKMVAGVALCGAAGVLIVSEIGGPILGLVYTEAYAAHSGVLVWLVAAASVRVTANLLQFGVIASRKFWWLCWQNGVMLVVSIFGCLFLIPAHGIAGAGMVMLMIFCAQLLAVLMGIWLILNAARR